MPLKVQLDNFIKSLFFVTRTWGIPQPLNATKFFGSRKSLKKVIEK